MDIEISDSGFKVSERANVEFVLAGSNNVMSMSCKKETNYLAIKIPGGATTAAFSVNRILNVTAKGYGASVGTKGYYRDGLDYSDNSKFSRVVTIKSATHVNATSAYGAEIGGDAVNGSSYIREVYDDGIVCISENAKAEATYVESYSAGIGGDGCYTSTCERIVEDEGVIDIYGNAQVTAKYDGSLGTGIGWEVHVSKYAASMIEMKSIL